MLLATDTYSRSNAFGLKSEFVNLPYFNVATEPLPEEELSAVLPSRQAITDTRKILSSYRLDREGRLIVGSIGGLAGAGGSIHMAWTRRAITRLFPQLRHIRLDHGWSGLIGMTATHLPAIHEPAPGVLSVGGYNGRGIAAGTVTGRMIAEYLLGRRGLDDLPLPISPIKPARFRAVRGQVYEWAARAVHLCDAHEMTAGDRL